MAIETIGPAEARRIAIAASGLARPRPALPGPRQVAATIDRLGLLQIDSVSVLVRAHYLPLFSRLGPYDRDLLDRAAWGARRSLFEYWAHEASLVPLSSQPLLRWRMARAAQGRGLYSNLAAFAREQPARIEAVAAEVARRGPLAASDLEGAAVDDAAGKGGWWGWSDAKRALEFLFWAGRLTAATRRGSFERVYDLPGRVLPAAVRDLPDPDPATAQRDLLRIAARALGIATAGDLRDYFRLGPQDAAPAIASLVASGELRPVAVRGWNRPAYLYHAAPRPRRVRARALLAPFDPLVWHRPRTERLFGFTYRLEIYTPAARRRHGYYVLPFLLGDQLVGRVDLKSHRAAHVLLVQAAHAEERHPPDLPDELAAELREMARWLGLGRIEVAGRGRLAPALAAALAA